MGMGKVESTRFTLEDEDSRDFLRKVFYAVQAVAKNSPENADEIFNILGIGDGPKYQNNKTVNQLRTSDYFSKSKQNHPEAVSPRIQAVRVRALQMGGMASRDDSTEMDG